MPAQAPPIADALATRLRELGEGIRASRRRQKISAATAAEAAGMSRVTLHRIERGEPSVTMGAYLSAIDAVGLRWELRDPQARSAATRAGPSCAPPLLHPLPKRLRLADFPALRRLAWQRHDADEVTHAEALNLYERNWRHLDPATLEPAERALIQALADQLSAGRLLV
ncbi:MAG TPA: helix-turn-helix domain-containing protein [Rubrivivax sp.]|nr:helix-turn-helix domain-containing protein [Rubrivivax sp.]